MKPSEASKKLEFHSKQICHGCVHPSMVGWCENHCQLPEAFEMAISALEKQEQDRWHVVAEEGNPPKMGYYLWSANGGAVEIDFFDGEKWEKATTYLYEVLAWKYRPKAYTEEES